VKFWDYQQYNIKNGLLKRLQDELGVQKILKGWITGSYGQGFQLLLKQYEVEVE
jgi:hypothetical protein